MQLPSHLKGQGRNGSTVHYRVKTQLLVLGKGKEVFEERNEAFFGQMPETWIPVLT